MLLKDKNIVIGVTGSISAYKALELTRLLRKEGANIFPVMTASARAFISPLSLSTLAENPVSTDLFNTNEASLINHIELAEKADLVIIAPATANIIGKLANGIADDILSTLVLATEAPLLIAPAMNNRMYTNKAVTANIERLGGFLGANFVGPATGELACGSQGPGRLAELEEIKEATLELLGPKDFAGEKILVTAGGTREMIDPVRYVSNASSGKMGYAIAKSAKRRGAEVVLVSGPSLLEPPEGVAFIKVLTAKDMLDEAFTHFTQSTIVIMAAAISDYRPTEICEKKIKKEEAKLSIELVRTTDILKRMGEEKGSRTLVGFALETDNIVENATKKLKEKNLDMVIANSEAALSSEVNQVTLICKGDEPEETETLDKAIIAELILDRVNALRRG